jgi:hypothetical protein
MKGVSLRMISPVYDKYPLFESAVYEIVNLKRAKTQNVRDYRRNPHKSYLYQWTSFQEPNDEKLSSPVLKERCPGVTPASTLTSPLRLPLSFFSVIVSPLFTNRGRRKLLLIAITYN